jgi:hypothetical protein
MKDELGTAGARRSVKKEWVPSHVFCALDQTAMSNPSIPQETWDHILDFFHGESKTLQQCCLVSKSWVPRSRKHLFREIRIMSPADLKTWKKAFPDPVDSPAYCTRSLMVSCERGVAGVAAEEGGWVRAFSNVIRLQLWGGTRNVYLRPPSPASHRLQLSPCSSCNPFILKSIQNDLFPPLPRGSGNNRLWGGRRRP